MKKKLTITLEPDVIKALTPIATLANTSLTTVVNVLLAWRITQGIPPIEK